MNIKRYYILAMLSLLVFVTVGCDVYHYHPDQRDITPSMSFSGIMLDGAGDVTVYPGGTAASVTVTADVDVVDDVSAEVDTSRLLRIGEIERDAVGNIISVSGDGVKGGINVDVRTPALGGVGLAGKGKIKVAAGPASPTNPNVTGTADHFAILHTGIGDIDAREYKASVATVIFTGSGTIRVWAEDTLYVSITAHEGRVIYRGSPKIIWFDHINFSEYYRAINNVDSPPPQSGATIETIRIVEADYLFTNSVKSGSTPSTMLPVTDGFNKDIWLEDSDFADNVLQAN